MRSQSPMLFAASDDQKTYRQKTKVISWFLRPFGTDSSFTYVMSSTCLLCRSRIFRPTPRERFMIYPHLPYQAWFLSSCIHNTLSENQKYSFRALFNIRRACVGSTTRICSAMPLGSCSQWRGLQLVEFHQSRLSSFILELHLISPPLVENLR